jgi:hypothetical protein
MECSEQQGLGKGNEPPQPQAAPSGPRSFKVAGVDVQFPEGVQPYGVQVGFSDMGTSLHGEHHVCSSCFRLSPQFSLMSKLINTLNEHGNALLEAPTGSGKVRAPSRWAACMGSPHQRRDALTARI